jgi:hypothetical protein
MTIVSPMQPGNYPQRLFFGETEDLLLQFINVSNFNLSAGF